ncbi:hypothetical protein OOK31_22605 [Streptomyces sp. NBC_00249]|uniref:hypothetical protein n=1 Tax=Streptomyces sp. NBC_00249 TaxID=2975690 RepID=UPI00224D9225|nr:hypothetical protein [Streptomyces sp. NBC_00249]MCX5196648.1 hypothetical protein [Streptomyces sp. NBC_00249]
MGSGPAPLRATAACATTALLTAALLGCAGGTRTTPATPAPHTTTPQELCTALITHWAGVVLDGGEGQDAVHLDYQAMGLSGGQNEILRTVLDLARPVQRTQGRDAARALTAREASARCAERYRSGAPTGGPWQ